MMKKTRGVLAALALLLVLATSAFAAAPTFPWQTYMEAASAMTAPPLPVCSNGGQFIALGQNWGVFTWNDRDLFIHYNDEGKGDYVYLAVGGINSTGGRIVIKQIITVDEAKRRFADPCAYGDERLT